MRRSPALLHQAWQACSGVLEPRTVTVIGAPMRFGQPKPGTEQGPNALRDMGLIKAIRGADWIVEDLGDCEFPEPSPSDPVLPRGGHNTFAVMSSNARLCETVRKPAADGRFVLTLGGDHSIAMGSISGLLSARPSLGVIWVDAHADINDFTSSPSGNVHGMPVSFLTRLINPAMVPGAQWMTSLPALPLDRIVYIGLRDLDEGEKEVIKRHNVKAFSMHHVDKYGIGKIMEMTLDHVAKPGCPLHLSWDIDAIDPVYAPSTGTTVAGGLTYREAHYMAESIAETGLLGSMDLVEVNPLLESREGAVKTEQVAIQLVQSVLGKSIL